MTAQPGYYQPSGAPGEYIDPAGTYTPGFGYTAPLTDPAGTYTPGFGYTAPLTDPAGTYSPAGASHPTEDPAGTFSGPGASQPLEDPAGTYSGVGSPNYYEDPAGTYSGVGSAQAYEDPPGTYSPAGSAYAYPAGPGYYDYGTGNTAEYAAPAGYYDPGFGNTAPYQDPAGTFSGPAAALPTADPAGTFSGPGAAQATEDPAGTYSGTGAASATPDPAGTYSGAGASQAITDPAGTYSPAGAADPTQDPAGTFSGPGAAAATVDPAGTYSPAGAAAATIDPAGTYSQAGAATPTPAGAGYYDPGTGNTAEYAAPAGYYDTGSGNTAAYEDPAGTFSGPAAAVPTTDPAGTFSGPGAAAATVDPAGTYSPAGAAAATIDPAGTYSQSGAAAPTPAGAGYYDPGTGNTAEYADPTLTVTQNPVTEGGDSAVPFTVSGLLDGVAATVTFTDSAGDTVTVDITGQAANTLDDTANLSSLVPGNVTSSLDMPESEVGPNFTPVAGNDITIEAPACFCRGTLIRTPNGDAPVESLRAGDLVTLSDGATAPISWLGQQTISTRFADPLRALPIRIKAGALGENIPARDLLISPEHAILADDILVQAGALVNGVSIRREAKMPEIFTYYHVEVAGHALILAENTPAETFVDNVDRLAFDNWDEHPAPDADSIVEMDYPRARSARQVPQELRARLMARVDALRGPNRAAA